MSVEGRCRDCVIAKRPPTLLFAVIDAVLSQRNIMQVEMSAKVW